MNDQEIRKNSETINDKTPLEIIIDFLGPEILLFLLLIFYLYNLGNANGIRQVEFRTLNSNPEKVVLYMNSEIMICSDFDRENRTVNQSFVVIKIGDDHNIKLSLEKVGSLKSIPVNPLLTNILKNQRILK